ncbi:hypothetical protein [Marinobacterium stanieri]|uniref:hypothetical protein n=1 Tax=Marinobacterium stanieri TaxID=49186 RepID=UPI0002557826|nr:hypothetical protein [Marinobacterium stanieri]
MSFFFDRLFLLAHGAALSAYLIVPAIFLDQRDYGDVVCFIALTLFGLVVLAMLIGVGVIRLRYWWTLRRIDQLLEESRREP